MVVFTAGSSTTATQDLERSRQPGGAAGQGSQRISKQLAQALCSLAEMKIGAVEQVTEVRLAGSA